MQGLLSAFISGQCHLLAADKHRFTQMKMKSPGGGKLPGLSVVFIAIVTAN
jgi:hypothetical protein